MTSNRARTCSAPIRRMASLAEELHLLKASINEMSGRLEFLLTEIADLQLGHEVGKEEFAGESQPHGRHQERTGVESGEPLSLEPPDTALLLAAPALAACSEEMHVEHSVTDEAAAPACAPPLASSGCADAAELVADASTSPNPCSVRESETAMHDIPIVEPTLISGAPLPEIDLPAATTEPPANETEAPCGVIVPPQSAEPSNVIRLDEHRAVASRKNRSTVLRQVARWAAAIALITVAVVAAATGAGLASRLDEPVSLEYGCANAPEICSVIPF
jgi:hypothetical protein